MLPLRAVVAQYLQLRTLLNGHSPAIEQRLGLFGMILGLDASPSGPHVGLSPTNDCVGVGMTAICAGIHSSSRPCRFSYNWLKLRAWELTDYDAVLLLDSDMTVVRPCPSWAAIPLSCLCKPYQLRLLPAVESCSHRRCIFQQAISQPPGTYPNGFLGQCHGKDSGIEANG